VGVSFKVCKENRGHNGRWTDTLESHVLVGDMYDMSILLGFFLEARDNSYAQYGMISSAKNGIEQKDQNLRITSPMLLHDTAVIPATNVKALRSNILI
jgi:hypothetical protein